MSREEILHRIGGALDIRSRRSERVERAAARLAGAVNERKSRYSEALVSLFLENLRALGVDVTAVPEGSALPAAVANYLEASALPLRLRHGADARLAQLPWREAPSLQVDAGPAEEGDSAGLSWAVAGVAETGTLVLASGAANPTTLAFLPDTHLVIVSGETIVATYEDACAMAGCRECIPRLLNFITGASRTGDIGGRIVMGAHGPRRLAVFLVGEGSLATG